MLGKNMDPGTVFLHCMSTCKQENSILVRFDILWNCWKKQIGNQAKFLLLVVSIRRNASFFQLNVLDPFLLLLFFFFFFLRLNSLFLTPFWRHLKSFTYVSLHFLRFYRCLKIKVVGGSKCRARTWVDQWIMDYHRSSWKRSFNC